MSKTQIPSIKAGVNRLKQNPQLWWTIVVAIVIFVAFIYIANLFVSIAQDAQDRLINVRVGSIHDTLAEYVYKADTNELQEILSSIATQNPTISQFRVVSVTDNENRILASLNTEEVDKNIEELDQLVKFSLSDPQNSFTNEFTENNERYYVTFRAFANEGGEVVGYIETKQALSEADRVINTNIRTSILIFLIVLIFVMLLFLRHAKIIDYVSLYKKLKEVDSLKDDFISMASHELKSPLAVIRGYAEFLREARELKEENREYARRIDVSSKQLTYLIEDMLDVSRIEQDRMKFEFTTFDIVAFLKEQFENFNLEAKNKNLKLDFESNVSNQEIILDQNKLRQIFVNLLSNAIKYTKEGGVTVKLNIEKDKKVELRVSDTGIGMTGEQSAKLFEKFSRIQTKETEEISGTGLGLWITKQLVEKMGGKISVESIKGKGTDFVVIFPVK